jgi:predicted AlkP superfamily pyrophosphatase or phosphodiesterase
MTHARGLLLGLCLVLMSCAQTGAREAAADQQPITILVSIDGFRPDYLDRGVSPTLSRLAEEGVRASMRPSFPSVTFPNHYTLVTGRRPGAHGMINNRMEDPERPGVVFTIGNRVVASDPFWWRDATPIWVSAERQGVRTGTMFWPGSDLELGGVRPTQWRQFDQSMPDFARVDVLLSWFDAPGNARPAFATLYFDIVDTMGHRFGPEAPETNSAIAQVDAAMARLIDGLRARGLERAVNLVIVADHGMSQVSEDRIISLDALAPADIARVVWDGPFAGIAPVSGREAEADAALLQPHEHGQCWRKAELPTRYAYSTHTRIPAIICVAERGWRYRSAVFPPYPTPALGAHGYDPEDSEMAAVFIASGPAFQHGAALETFDNVSVYPLLAELIDITPESNDGALSDVAPALVQR